MKLVKLGLVVSVAGVLGGCGYFNDEEVVENADLIESTIIITSNEDTLEETVSFEEGLSLLEVMEDNLDIEQEDSFITTIEGIEQSPEDNTWWVYEVNEEMVTVGASDYILEDGDVAEWELTSF